tara:strand:+ start:648 stop:1019 length:372 start_codon:yes stop_codon:yes gene_type:complete
MKHKISSALQELKPGATWTLRGDNYSGLEWLDSGQTKPTETEINNKIIELDNAEAMRLLRIERNKRLTECDWVITKANETDIPAPLPWKEYRQKLRDLTNNANPKLDELYELDLSSVDWPTSP